MALLPVTARRAPEAVVAEPRLHRSCAAVVAQRQAVVAAAELRVAVAELPAARYPMYLELTQPDQWLDQCCAAVQPSLDSFP